jgi:hypothetical protein
MNVSKLVKEIRERIEHADVERTGDVNVVKAVNIGQSDETTGAHAVQDVEIVQNGRRTHWHDET